jgi:hypothetical protein
MLEYAVVVHLVGIVGQGPYPTNIVTCITGALCHMEIAQDEPPSSY